MYTRIEALLITFTQAKAKIEKQDSIRELTEEFIFDLLKEVYSTARDSFGVNLSRGLRLIVRNTLEEKRIDGNYLE